MSSLKKFVLPFKWREFGSWFSKNGSARSRNDLGSLAIKDMYFTAGQRNLNGIKIEVDLKLSRNIPNEIFLCGFLADLEQLQLFEPFIGNPDSSDETYHASRKIITTPDKAETFELFIPEAGWVLPSIWRFLIQSLGLRPKGQERMPDVIVFAFAPGGEVPLLFATRPFDYYGNTQRLKEKLILGDFFRLLNLTEDAAEADVQRAYIHRCRDLQATEDLAEEAVVSKNNHFSRIKQGYQVWSEQLQKKRELS